MMSSSVAFKTVFGLWPQALRTWKKKELRTARFFFIFVLMFQKKNKEEEEKEVIKTGFCL